MDKFVQNMKEISFTRFAAEFTQKCSITMLCGYEAKLNHMFSYIAEPQFSGTLFTRARIH